MTQFVQSPSTPWRRVGYDILLAPEGRDDFDHLSGTAAVVWSLLDTPATLQSLLDVLGELYLVPGDSIAADVGSLVADLIRRGAIREIP